MRYDRTHIYVNICAVQPVSLYCPLFDPFSPVRYDRTHIGAVRPVFLYLLTLCPFLYGSQSRTSFIINFETNFGNSRSYYKITFVINKALKIRLTSFKHNAVSMTDAGEFPRGAAHTLYAWRYRRLGPGNQLQ